MAGTEANFSNERCMKTVSLLLGEDNFKDMSDSQAPHFFGDEGKATHREHTQGFFYPNTKHLWALQIFNFVED